MAQHIGSGCAGFVKGAPTGKQVYASTVQGSQTLLIALDQQRRVDDFQRRVKTKACTEQTAQQPGAHSAVQRCPRAATHTVADNQNLVTTAVPGHLYRVTAQPSLRCVLGVTHSQTIQGLFVKGQQTFAAIAGHLACLQRAPAGLADPGLEHRTGQSRCRIVTGDLHAHTVKFV